ncbi:MAG TPA: hypothetical protein QGF58_27910 [Myxococcota bacterium]|nr:hypothetical protein [Myxococcota bacterium]
MLLGLLLTTLPGRAEPPTDEARAGLVEQVDLPALSARKQAADARFEAASAAFRGEVDLDRAFPHLADRGPMPDARWVAGQLARLDAEGARRAAERVESLDDERLETTREAALSAEDGADALERRFLLSIRSMLEDNPRLSADHLAPLVAEYDEARAEADPEDGLAIAAIDEERRYLRETLREIVAAAAVPSATLSAERDLERLQDPEVAAHAAERLLLIRDLVDDSSQIDEALEPWLASVEPPAVARDLDSIDSELAALEHRLEVAHWEAELAWLERSVAELGELREEVAVELARLEDGVTVDLEVEAARAAAVAAEGGHNTAIAEVVEATYEEVTRATRIRGEVDAEGLVFADKESSYRRRLADLQAIRADLATRPSLDASRESDAIDAWRQTRDLVLELRDAAFARPSLKVDDWARERRAEISASEALLAADSARTEGVTDEGVVEALDRREQTLLAERQDMDRRVAGAEAHDAAILALLSEAKQLRRELKSDVPRAIWLAEEEVIEEALTETRLLAPNVWTLGKHRLAELLVWPSVGAAMALMRGVVGLGLVGLLWWALRSRAELLVRAVVRRWAGTGRESRRRREQLDKLVHPATPEVRAALDVLGVWLLFEPAMELFPEAGIVLLVYGQVAAYRLLSGAYALLVARFAESRPALFFVTPGVYALGEKTVRWLVFWVVARQFLDHVWLDLVGADALHELTMRGLAVVLVVLIVRLLHLWEPELRARIGRQGADNPLAAWLMSEPSAATRWLRALVATMLLGVGATWRFAQSQVSERSALGRLLNIFYRYRLSEEEESVEHRPLPKDVAAAIETGTVEADWIIDHPETDETFWAAVLRWKDHGETGVMALVTDRGGGRRTWLDLKTQKLADKGYGIARLSLDHRVTGEEPLCLWLSRSLGLEPSKDVAGVCERLAKRPPTVIVIDRCHYAFLRTVGGFEAMRALLDVIGESSRHFWLACFHKPSWAYLSRLDRLLKIHLIRDIVELPPLEESALQKLTQDRTDAAGYELDFGGLVRRGALSGDVEGELERATRAFYRVLGEASYGNPAVALQLWSESLSPTTDKTLQVRLGAAVQETRADDLAEPELFTLAALRMQEALSEPELAKVNNVSAAAVRSSLQVLAAKGLVARGHLENWEVPLRQLPCVTRTLVHKNLLEWR